MSKLAALSGGTGVTVGAGAAAVGAVAIALYATGVFSPKETEAPVTPVPVVQTEAPQTTETAAVPVQTEAPETGPSFDVVRVETDGSAMIAGRAEAGSTVAIRLDDEVLAEVKADARGKFASFVTLSESAQPRVLTLNVQGGEIGPEQVIVAPVESAALPQADVATTADTEQSETNAARSAEEQPVQEPAAKAPTVLLATDEGVRVLQTPDAPKPEAMTALLGSISYDDAGEVALTGRGGGQFVRVYLDNEPITLSQIAPNGDWQAELPSVDTGIYTLRVDELDAEGAVVSRVETPFKREDSAVLAAAVQPDTPVQAITVQPGATLWAIARERYGSGTLYTRVVEANADAIRNPDLIYPGQVFTVPN